MNEVIVEDWDYRCGDGCCYEWGTTIYVNGEQLDLMSNPEDHLDKTIEAVLKALGVDAVVTYRDVSDAWRRVE